MVYTKDNMFGISIAIIFGGVVLIMVGAPCLSVCFLSGFYRNAGSPVWTGMLAIVTGVSGILVSKNEKVDSMSVTFLLLNILVIVAALFAMILSAIGAYWESTVIWVYHDKSSGLVLYVLVELVALAVLIISCIASFLYCCGVGERQIMMVQQQLQQLPNTTSTSSRVLPPRSSPAALYVKGHVQVSLGQGSKSPNMNELRDNGSHGSHVDNTQAPEYKPLQAPPEYQQRV